jgi:phosphoenolpyruvate carboxykinase (ATP)
MDKKNESLRAAGFHNLGHVHWNHPTPSLCEQAVHGREGLFAHHGPLVVRTGQYTGRSPRDKYFVEEPGSSDSIWWGDVNQPFSPDQYNQLRSRVLTYLQDRELFIQEVYGGANPEQRISLRVITESAWHALFARTMFIRELNREVLKDFEPEYTLIHAPHFHADPEIDGTRSEVFVILNFGKKEIIIGGTQYAGEIKKSIFTLMNYILPLKGILSMHCSSNYGKNKDDVALFFGLSGTGKTSLSIDPSRTLVGDDEHGWGKAGIFNIEGGCYAKVIRISSEHEPEIYQSTRKFGTILENVSVDSLSRRIDLDDDSLTENTRAAFPITHLEHADPSGVAGHPKIIFFLTADAFGVLPPVAKLTPEQAIYYFLLAYTAKVAGTERGIVEPEATFSPCFGAPFMVHTPAVYAEILGKKIRNYGAQVWLVNTGWTGGPYGTGERMKLPYTRSMVHAVLKGKLNDVPLHTDPLFNLNVPIEVPEVPSKVFYPRDTWKDKNAYDRTARELVSRFREAFKRFEGEVSRDVREAGPT